ncbi:GNAT family N-acetyltransferase [Pediococcus pentosaceus]|uniref:GNAT family N-acetyltransferase n=1 Tax=Pediococcus pentosaceus TaxID=1255 RepID=UPI001F567BA9|nr:GNAT family N-acetyltransferase [Pediococcus pentosaceus]MCI2960545.1 GNAT family N-acetyltransferase [Pediococcus pentosaceus]
MKESDLLFYKEIIPQALDSVNLIVWKNQNHKVVGFSGIDKDELVMLFLDPQFIGQGYGREILSTLVRKYDIKRIDVNSQNVQAKRFYLKNNFKIDSEDPVDGFGKPYPITHLIRSI